MSNPEIERPGLVLIKSSRTERVQEVVDLITGRGIALERVQQIDISALGDILPHTPDDGDNQPISAEEKFTKGIKAATDSRRNGIDYSNPPSDLSYVSLADLRIAEKQGFERGRAASLIDETQAAYELGKYDSDTDNAAIIVEMQDTIDALKERLARYEGAALDDSDEQPNVQPDTE
jgi:hypothetical protein